ncbi:MAG TPA: TIR domain-containing protein, partial [Candidatus Nitrosotalea sp.]|nr:TIR domain-containing protein [Candidatus Nitrosotalea sp.]
MTQSTNATKRKFFVSRAGADAAFGAEIGRILEEAGYEVVLQQWDFANRNFMERIHTVLAEGARVVALLSPEYLRSDHCQAEWQNTIAGDPLNNESRLILLRVAECEPGGLLSGLAYWDLLPICESSAMVREVVLDAVAEEHRGATPSGPYWRAPQTIVEPEAIRPVPGFSGRDEDLGAIAAALRDDGGIAIVHGLGGVGKSSVARQYAWRNRDRYAVVWWLNAENEDGIVDGFLRLGALFTRGLDRLADRRAAAQQVTGSMLGGFAKPVLLIFDNLEDERLLRSWQPRTGACILVTSRNASWGGDTALISLDVWPRETALTYVRRESGRTDFSEAEANEIVNSLGALPLALSHAAATLRSMRMLTPARYLERIGEHLANAPRYAEYPRSVFATFQTAVADAEQQAPGAAALFCFAAHFAPDAIPDELFRQSADLYPEKVRAVLNEDRIDEALGALDQMSLLSFAVASRTFSMHRLVQLVGRELAGEAKLEWGRSAVSVAETLFPAFSSNVQFATLPQCARLLAHARAALDTLPDDEEHVVAGRLADRCAYYLREEGNLKSAEPLHERVVKIFERAYGVEHPETASAFNNLAELRWAQGRFEEAASLYGRALAIYEKTLGP